MTVRQFPERSRVNIYLENYIAIRPQNFTQETQENQKASGTRIVIPILPLLCCSDPGGVQFSLHSNAGAGNILFYAVTH